MARVFEKNHLFHSVNYPHFQFFCLNERLEFCQFFEWKIKRINNAELFLQPVFIIFTRGPINSEHDCM